jgi:hypothetical protein
VSQGNEMIAEIWKSVRGFDGYEVSNLGRVRSIDRVSKQIRYGKKSEVFFRGKIIRLSTNQRGYLQVCLWRNNRPTGFVVHRLIAETFLREINQGEEVNHFDFDKQNNALSNLEITTRAGNILHTTLSGRLAKKLTDDAVRQIRYSKLWGDDNRSLAKRFGVSRAAIRVVAAGQFWKRIDLSEWLLGHE